MDNRVIKQTAVNLFWFFSYAAVGAITTVVSIKIGAWLFGDALDWIGLIIPISIYGVYLAYEAAKFKVEVEQMKEQRLIDTIASQTGSQ